MSARFFQPKSNQPFNPINLIQDILQVIRDVATTVNGSLNLQWLSACIDFLDVVIGCFQGERNEFAPAM